MEEEAKEVEAAILGLIKELDAAIENATHVNQVIHALHSMASMLFDVQMDYLPGKIDQANLNQVVGIPRWKIGQEAFRRAFYKGFSFPTLAKLLVFKVASNWLGCFPLSARTSVFDVFFLNAPATEALQALMLGFARVDKYAEHQEIDVRAVCSNTERILILCLVENEGLKKMAVDFGISSEVNIPEEKMLRVRDMENLSRIAQLVASIPDKARLESPKELSAHHFFKQVTTQLLAGAEEKSKRIFENFEISNRLLADGTFIFIGETFSRICRRGHADIVASEMVPRLLQHVRNCLDSNADMMDTSSESVQKIVGSSFWQAITAAIKDSHAMERWTEALLRQMAVAHLNDVEAYWMIWALFENICKIQGSTRALFTEKFLLWKVFPISCLRWILHFAVFHCSPKSCLQGRTNKFQLDVVRHVVEVWAKKEFVQSASMDQQAYITAAVGLSVEKMTKEDLELSGEISHSLLQGVSCRLDSPINPVRKMASHVALTFSKVIDPKNPLFLDDDNCTDEINDWEFGVSQMNKETLKVIDGNPIIDGDDTKKSIHMVDDKFNERGHGIEKASSEKEDSGRTSFKLKRQRKKTVELQADNPDEVIDLAALNAEEWSDEDDNESVESENPSESSLQPYDLSDDDSDLKRLKFPSQLSDCVAALRKGDDADAVERALDVTEKLVRAVPDELNNVAVDLVRALVHVRCSAVAVEGQEESAEEKRHCALVALLVSCPLISVEVLGKELYSPHVNVSQRLLILDVMADAAQELSESRDLNRENYVQERKVSTVTELLSGSSSNPWYLPSGKITPPGAGPWREVSKAGAMVSWSHHYERELPSRPGDRKLGKSRRWGPRSMQLREKQLNQFEAQPKNRFPPYAAAFMLPIMRGYDKRRHGVDLLGRDFLVLGKLIYTLGICMECVALHPEASVLALALLDMLNSRDISNHVEAYVRRSALFAASRILIAVHPSFIATALSGDDHEIVRGLEWIRNWALHVAEVDSDIECSTMAMACVQLHSEMALQAMRSVESVDNSVSGHGKMSYNVPRSSIILPLSK